MSKITKFGILEKTSRKAQEKLNLRPFLGADFAMSEKNFLKNQKILKKAKTQRCLSKDDKKCPR
jgi:hypothetical protein